jgi:hypothetical protein
MPTREECLAEFADFLVAKAIELADQELLDEAA